MQHCSRRHSNNVGVIIIHMHHLLCWRDAKSALCALPEPSLGPEPGERVLLCAARPLGALTPPLGPVGSSLTGVACWSAYDLPRQAATARNSEIRPAPLHQEVRLLELCLRTLSVTACAVAAGDRLVGLVCLGEGSLRCSVKTVR